MSLLNNITNHKFKVWVYTSASIIDENIAKKINAFASTFINNWESHGTKLEGGIEIIHNRFIVIYADDCNGTMCGRAQDAQVRFVKDIEARLSLDLLNRMNIAFKDENNTIEVLPLPQFSTFLKTLSSPKDLIVYDNTITNMLEFQNKWELPISQTWMSRLI